MPSSIIITADDRELLPLYDYVRNGLFREVENWIRDGKPVYNPESRKFPIIVYAARSGFYSILQELLRLDWKVCPRGLNKALAYSVDLGNVYATELLLSSGSDPESIGWDSVFYPRIPAIVTAFFKAKKSTRRLYCGLDYLDKNTAAVVKNIYKSSPEIEASLFLAAKEALRRWHWEMCGHQVVNQNRTIAHNAKIIGLLYWIGLDLDKAFPDIDGVISVREMATEMGIALKHKRQSEQ